MKYLNIKARKRLQSLSGKDREILNRCFTVNFEDGNEHIVQHLLNYMIHPGYPIIVVHSHKKSNYLRTLYQANPKVGVVPSDGAQATLKDIGLFLRYFNDMVATEVYNEAS